MTGIFSDFIKNEVTTEDKKTSLFDRQKEGFKKDNSICLCPMLCSEKSRTKIN